MESTDKVISLFKYIKELYGQKYQIVTDVKSQQWYKLISDIPQDDEYINLNFLDRTSDDEEDTEGQSIILEVQKPEFDSCPVIPKTIENWVVDGWQRFANMVVKKEHQGKIINDVMKVEHFTDDPNRVQDYNKWLTLREQWIQIQQKIDKIRRFFNELYFVYSDLENDSEIIELMVGQGLLSCTTENSTRINHPILLKRVSMEFDSGKNILRIVDSNVDPEIYTMLLQRIDFINHAAVKATKEELAEKFYHPLDRNDTPDFLKSFVHRLHSESKYTDDLNDVLNDYEKIIVYNNPVFFIRKRTGGVEKAIEEIIRQIEETGEVSGPLLNLIGENVSQLTETMETLDLSESLAAINGEDKDILLSKEANREQLEIAKQIENYNAVLVQGPPGTGKTHTIANLVGHFLAQGKNILVTSHTKKALSVVKEKVVPELQNLCVSVLQDNNRDMERSIDGITEYISSHTSLELAENTEQLKRRRDQILSNLADVRKKLFAIKYKEYESIIFGGKGYSPSEAARFVFENKEALSYIPGKVVLYKPLPVSMSDLELVYKTNDEITIKEETELENELPNPNKLLSTGDFERLIKRYFEIENELNDINRTLKNVITIDMVTRTATINGQQLCENIKPEKIEQLKNLIGKNESANYSSWQLQAILDGKKGGGFKKVWENLLNAIEDAYNYAGDIAEITIGKKITGSAKIGEQTVSLLKEIKNHLELGKKLSGFTLLMHKDWKELCSGVMINNQSIETADDCDVLISLCQLQLKRNLLGNLWTELIAKNDGVAYSELGDEPEQVGISYIPKIKASIEWYKNTFSAVKQCIFVAGFNKMLMREDEIHGLPIDEISFLINEIYTIFPKYVKIAELLYIELTNLHKKLEDCIQILNDKDVTNSFVCKELREAIKEKNSEAYKKQYELLSTLYTKYYYLSERFRILNEIEQGAPEWANLIRNRVGIHGQGTLPKNLEEAWKWKQFAGIIDEITAQPFEALQRKLVGLNAELRTATSKLAENSAWYHLLNRIEGDISKKQALQGWKMTEKKIGKGTGKRAPALRREAQKLMVKCQTAVPAWIMPVNKALETLDPTKNKFDIVIIDEASQSDISALAIMYLAKKIIIVGDDEQVSPSAVGLDQDKMINLAKMTIKGIIPNAHLYDMNSSLYDIAKTTFPTLMLKEHFRCVPSIIGYSNRLSYDYKIKPLRDDSQVLIKPATIAYRVNGERQSRKKTNDVEAQTIVALMMACMEHKEYENMTFGVITLLGDEQAKKINKLAIENIMPDEYDKRRILCGNASNFQGDERDIIFLTLVDSNEGDGPLRMAGEGIGKSTKQRYNVAVSRAKDQIWVVHSLDVSKDLKSGDMRRDLIEYVTDPNAFQEQLKKIKAKADSPFEVSVSKALVKNGYKIVQQWPVGSYRIDMVAVCQDKKIAIECDGELYHSGDEKIREDMERQAVLERLGWRFIRIRGSEYYGEPEETMRRVMRELTEYEIEPEESLRIDETSGSELQQSVIAAAGRILLEWEKEKLVDCEMENAQNFDRPYLSEWHEIANENVVSGLLH
ncbi:MAG: AAA domain-containing protein [Acetobacterium sp.]|uniref:AAA domain-containing protein n=1 Tax=Acetobacterium sp. TaxID=1872094 RepID=UPI003242FAFB